MMHRKYLLIVQSPSGPIRFAMVLSLSPGRCSGYCEFRGNIVPIETVQIDSRQQVELKAGFVIGSAFPWRSPPLTLPWKLAATIPCASTGRSHKSASPGLSIIITKSSKSCDGFPPRLFLFERSRLRQDVSHPNLAAQKNGRHFTSQKSVWRTNKCCFFLS